MKKTVVVIPAFNEELSIGQVIESIPKTILSTKVTVLVVDDGSSDKTVKIAKKHGATVISHRHNQGVGKAFHTGLDFVLDTKADYMINMDADGQFKAKDIPKLLKPIIEGEAEFVAANRFVTKSNKIRRPKNMPKSKYYGNLLMAKLISFLTGKSFTDVSSGFRAYSQNALLNLNLTGKFTYTQETFIDLVFKDVPIKSIPVDVLYFSDRRSKVASNLIKYTYRTFKIIIRTFRDYKPLLFFLYLSLLPLILAILTTVFFIWHYFNTSSFSPFKIVGFASLYLWSATFILWVVGFLADMFVRLRLNQEKIIYQQKMTNFK